MAKIAQSRNSDFHRFATIWLALWHHYRIIASNHFSSYNPGNYSQIGVYWERSLQRYPCGCRHVQGAPLYTILENSRRFRHQRISRHNSNPNSSLSAAKNKISSVSKLEEAELKPPGLLPLLPGLMSENNHEVDV